MEGIGWGVFELRLKDLSGACRFVYLLHAFKKKKSSKWSGFSYLYQFF